MILLQQIDGSIGASGANLPGFIQIDGLTFHASVDTVDCFVVNLAQTVTFSNCPSRSQNVSAPTGVGNSLKAGVKLESSGTRETEHINSWLRLKQCKLLCSCRSRYE